VVAEGVLPRAAEVEPGEAVAAATRGRRAAITEAIAAPEPLTAGIGAALPARVLAWARLRAGRGAAACAAIVSRPLRNGQCPDRGRLPHHEPRTGARAQRISAAELGAQRVPQPLRVELRRRHPIERDV